MWYDEETEFEHNITDAVVLALLSTAGANKRTIRTIDVYVPVGQWISTGLIAENVRGQSHYKSTCAGDRLSAQCHRCSGAGAAEHRWG